MTRVTATVLFTDLVGSTELRARLGSDGADELRRLHDRQLTQAVTAQRGQVVKGLGDGVMATFPSAADAVAAAVAIQQAVDRFNRTGASPAPLGVRVGLSAGDVSVEDNDVHGTPVVEASRLCAAAGGGTILAADVVRVLAGSEAACFEPAGTLTLKGLPDGLMAVRVAWAATPLPKVPLPGLLRDIGRIFVGRDGELERLTQWWKQAANGERRLALLAGEPGVGKTRLAADLAGRVHDEGATVLAGRCDEDLGVPYQPFVEALHHFVAHTAADELAARVGRFGGELTRLCPQLAERLPALPPPVASDAETERYRLFDAVAAWLSAATADEPVLLIVDDLHWAAKPTLALLRHVLRADHPMRLLVVGTYRDTDVARDQALAGFLSDLRRLPGAERLPLSGLDAADVSAFIAQAAGHDLDADGERLARAVWSETEGNPFFVTEVLRHLLESGALDRRDGRWVLTAEIEDLGIPEGVRDVVGRRLARLPDEANAVLACAAVVGSEFDVDIVRTAGGFSESSVVAALDEAAASRLLTRLPGTGARFRHALVRATLYDELTPWRRSMVHRQVAEAIEAVHAGRLEEHLPALAYHWARATTEAASRARAVDFSIRAGDRALAQLADDQAVALYRQALELVDPADDAARLRALLGLGEAQRFAGEPAHRATLLEAARLAQRLGDAETLARAAMANNRGGVYWSVSGSVDRDRVAMLEAALEAVGRTNLLTRARLLTILAAELTYTGDRERCERYSDEALDLARQAGDAATVGAVLLGRYFMVGGPERQVQARREGAELVDVAEGLGDPVLRFWAYHVRSRMAIEMADRPAAQHFVEQAAVLASDLRDSPVRFFECLVRGGFTVAVDPGEDAERVCREFLEFGRSQPEAVAAFGLEVMLLRLGDGDPRDAEPALRQARQDLPAFQAVAATLAALCCATGRDGEARDLLDDGEEFGFGRPPHNNIWLGTTLLWSAVTAHLGDVVRARALFEVLVDWPEQIAVMGGAALGSVSHHLGLLSRTLGAFDEAERYFGTGLETHERLGAPRLSAWTRLEWTRLLLLRRGPADVARARQLLSEALSTARNAQLSNLEREAAGLLAELG